MTPQILQSVAAAFAAPHTGEHYRCTYSPYGNKRDAISGEGALKGAGRYHPKAAFRAVYVGSTLELAHWEYFNTKASVGLPLSALLPMTTIAVHVSLTRVLDLSRRDVCLALGTTPAFLATYDWSGATGEPFTQKLGRLAQAEGLDALLFPSAVLVTAPNVSGLNLVAFPDTISLNPANVFRIQNQDKLLPPPIP